MNEGHTKPIRVWTDGCYDVVHFGHANAIRQAKAMGDHLVVGIHSDAEISLHKGPPVFPEDERYKMVRAIKWVDEVVEGSPFSPSLDTLDKYNCDFCVHGEDISLSSDGKDVYQKVKDAGRYKECKRTGGVSTTNLVGRMLLTATNHFDAGVPICSIDPSQINSASSDSAAKSPWTSVSPFLPTSQGIVQFSDGKEPNPGDKIIYTAGAFDLFHVGLLDFLVKAKKEGEYLIVGLHSDQEVNRYKGSNYPIMNLHERVLSILACRYVDQVIIGAPYIISEELMDQFKIDIVVHGNTTIQRGVNGEDPNHVPKQRGAFKIIDSQCTITTADIVLRVTKNRLQYEERNQKKEKKEQVCYEALQKQKQLINGDW